MSRSHCAECGYEGPKEGPLPQRGSDVIPIYECPECGDVAAIGCSCDDPDSHEPLGSS
ncbi:hypothetical protein [Saliphagus sp. LR7]|uniref:hypothetical protein n=1 Tax=Saliphagus sp. LR7 TaxID=2282654 RepID=UPI0013008A3E|nr:hypothetical protein [Saliphagus sp. LR7]